MTARVAGLDPLGERAQRLDRLVDVVTDRGFAKVSELSRLVGVSEVTIRSDLRSLDALGVLRRVRGGAEVADGPASDPPGWAASPTGSMAAALVRSGDRVVLDGSPQMLAVATGLVRRRDLHDVRVLVHHVGAAAALAPAALRLHVELPAGRVLPEADLLRTDELDVELGAFDLAFVGCDGLTAERVHVVAPERAAGLRGVLAGGKRVVLIAAASAVGATDGAVVCETAEIDACIVAGDPAPRLVADLTARGVQVLVTP